MGQKEPNGEGSAESLLRDLRSKLGSLKPEELLLVDELTQQLERTGRLLRGETDEAADAALARFAGQAEVEATIAAEVSAMAPLARPEAFDEAHRRTLHAVEVLEREGFRNPKVPRVGPLAPLLELGAEFIAEFIVKSYVVRVVGSMRRLYTRREAQSEPGSVERDLLRRARMEMERVAPTYSGGGLGAPVVVLGGLVVPVFASLTQYFGAVDYTNRAILFGGLGVLFVLFFLLSAMLLAGASVARRRSRLVLQQPLAGLWVAVGHAGLPPKDDATLFALAAIVMTALMWFVLPAVGAVVYFVL